jgi:hypothetical protein
MRFSLSLPIQHPMGDPFIVSDPAYCVEQIAVHQERLGIQQMGFRLHSPGLSHQRVLRAIELRGEHVLPRFQPST